MARQIACFSLTVLLLFLILWNLHAEQTENNTTYFGQSTSTGSALIGILYDLKQNQQKGKEYGWAYPKILGKFIDQGWDENILNDYYRVTRPLFATQVFIPRIKAETAPDAFGVAQVVEPKLWIVHYKGQVAPPRAGTYRFVGIADDTLAVAVNGETVLVGCFGKTSIPGKTVKDYPKTGTSVHKIGNAALGDWFELKKDEVIDLDIIIGEFPGGFFAAYLWIEEKGRRYEKDKDGKNILPIFQTGPRHVNSEKRYPAYAEEEFIWKCLQ